MSSLTAPSSSRSSRRPRHCSPACSSSSPHDHAPHGRSLSRSPPATPTSRWTRTPGARPSSVEQPVGGHLRQPRLRRVDQPRARPHEPDQPEAERRARDGRLHRRRWPHVDPTGRGQPANHQDHQVMEARVAAGADGVGVVYYDFRNDLPGDTVCSPPHDVGSSSRSTAVPPGAKPTWPDHSISSRRRPRRHLQLHRPDRHRHRLRRVYPSAAHSPRRHLRSKGPSTSSEPTSADVTDRFERDGQRLQRVQGVQRSPLRLVDASSRSGRAMSASSAICASARARAAPRQ